MEIRFDTDDLARLETDSEFDGGYSQAVVRAYRKVVNLVRQAVDERDFRNIRSLNFERLKGDRKHQHSMRLNLQWRLIVELEGKGTAKVVAIMEIEDYH